MYVRILTLMCVTILCVSGICKAFGETSCGDVRRSFMAKKLGALKMVPHMPKKAKDLRICSIDHVTCCTAGMERKYLQASQRDLRNAIKTKLATTKYLLTSFIREFEGDVENLNSRKYNETKAHLLKAFPEESSRDAVEILSKSLFGSLNLARYQTNRLNMASEIQAALSRTFKSIFILNIKRNLSQSFLNDYTCVFNEYQENIYFGNLPKRLSQHLFATFNNSLAFYEAVKSGEDSLKLIENSIKNRQCKKAVVKMEYCSHCYGLTLIKPCLGLCKNVIRGCLVGMSEIDPYWKHYLGALTFSAKIMNDRRSDIESGINVLVDEIANASLNQTAWSRILKASSDLGCNSRNKRSSGHSRKQTTNFSKRKRTRRGKRGRQNRNVESAIHGTVPTTFGIRPRIRPPHEVLQLAQPKRVSVTKVSSQVENEDEIKIDEVSRSHRIPDRRLRTKMLQFANQLNLSINFFLTLPDKLCDNIDPYAFQVAKHESCWDGNNIADRYNERVASKGLEGQQNNPEMRVTGLHPRMQKAVENLRLSSKALLLPHGEDSIPPALREIPYFVTRSNFRGSLSPPCDDEDECDDENSGESSGEDNNSDDDKTDSVKGTGTSKRKKTHREILPVTTSTVFVVKSAEPGFHVGKDTVMQIFNTSSINTKKIETLPITVDVETQGQGDTGSAHEIHQRNSWLRTFKLTAAICFTLFCYTL
uniref:Glypican-5 n=1 Tax=Phallusia mammillata TaxID=59560 RepID=A0A6F9DDD2_9ASCI|nr:glypican-5 [Phallusia mammillata]